MRQYCHACGTKYTETQGQPWVCHNCHYQYFENPITCVDFALFTSDMQLVITKRGFDPWKGKYELPGGFLEIGETLEACIEREAAEELNLKPSDYNDIRYISSHPTVYPYKNEDKQLIVTVFAARLNDNVKLTAQDDVVAFEFITRDKIQDIDFCYPDYVNRINNTFDIMANTVIARV